MVVIFLKSKCFSIKLKCSVGDQDRYWNIGRSRCCSLYINSSEGGQNNGVRKCGWWSGCMAGVRWVCVEGGVGSA
jgi:hypothetical protein